MLKEDLVDCRFVVFPITSMIHIYEECHVRQTLMFSAQRVPTFHPLAENMKFTDVD